MHLIYLSLSMCCPLKHFTVSMADKAEVENFCASVSLACCFSRFLAMFLPAQMIANMMMGAEANDTKVRSQARTKAWTSDRMAVEAKYTSAPRGCDVASCNS